MQKFTELVKYSSIAQSVEHAAVNRRVVGSSPTWGAKKERHSIAYELHGGRAQYL